MSEINKNDSATLFPDYFDPKSERKWKIDFGGKTYQFTEKTLSFYCVLLHAFLYNHDTSGSNYEFGCPMHTKNYRVLMSHARPINEEGENPYFHHNEKKEQCRKSGLNCHVKYLIKVTKEKILEKGKNWAPCGEPYEAILCVKFLFGLKFPFGDYDYNLMMDRLLREFHLWCGFNTRKVLPLLGDESFMNYDHFYQWVLLFVYDNYEPLNPRSRKPLGKGENIRTVKKNSLPLPSLPNEIWKEILLLASAFPPLVELCNSRREKVEFDSPMLFFEALEKEPEGILSKYYEQTKELCTKENMNIKDDWSLHACMVKYMDNALKKDLKRRVYPLVNLFKSLSLVCKEFYFIVRRDFFFRPIAYAMSKSKRGEELVHYEEFRRCFPSCKAHYMPSPNGSGDLFHFAHNWGSFASLNSMELKVGLSNDNKEPKDWMRIQLFGSLYIWWYKNHLKAEVKRCEREIRSIERAEEDVKGKLKSSRRLNMEMLTLFERMSKQPILPNLNKEIDERRQPGKKRKLSFDFKPKRSSWKRLKQRTA